MEKIFSFFIYFAIFSCTPRQKQQAEQIDPLRNGGRYVVDLDGKKEESIPYSYIFKNMQTIILETSEDCMIGMVNEIQVFDGCIYILDRAIAKSLFVFDTDGRFIRKIGCLGNGPGEFIQVDDFTLDTKNGVIYLQDRDVRIHKYQLDGTYIHSFTIQEPKINSRYIQFYDGRLYSSVLAWDPAPDDCMLMEIDPNDGQVLSRFLPLEHNKGWAKSFSAGNFFKSRLNNPPVYSQLFMDCIVSLDEGITPYIELKSRNLVTEDDLKNLPEGRSFTERLTQLFKGSSKIWNTHCFVENDDFIMFKYESGRLFFLTVIFHKKTGTVKIARKLTDDLILRRSDDTESIMSIKYGDFNFSNSKGAYEIIPPIIFERLKESIKNNEIVPNIDKKDQLLQLNAESNPIIFFYEYK